MATDVAKYQDILKYKAVQILKVGIILFIILIIIKAAAGASISGNVYDINLDLLSDVVVTINTTPVQKFVVKSSSFDFEVEQGTYDLEAKYFEDNILKYESSDEIQVDTNGDFVHDIILFPSLGDEEQLLEDVEIDDLIEVNEDELGQSRTIRYVFVVLIIAITAIWFSRKYSKKPINKPKIEQNQLSHDDIEEVLAFIRSNQRISQKELRKHFPVSEAKISLILSELESKGEIKKIKKGRANIIIYNQK